MKHPEVSFYNPLLTF